MLFVSGEFFVSKPGVFSGLSAEPVFTGVATIVELNALTMSLAKREILTPTYLSLVRTPDEVNRETLKPYWGPVSDSFDRCSFNAFSLFQMSSQPVSPLVPL